MQNFSDNDSLNLPRFSSEEIEQHTLKAEEENRTIYIEKTTTRITLIRRQSAVFPDNSLPV